jgi:hypothetical protein
MPGPAPKTDRWTARENRHHKRILLLVSGLVQVTATNKAPRLTAAGGAGKALALDLSIAAESGPGSEVLVWKRASHTQETKADHHDSVAIRWDGKTIASCKVLDDDEHHQRLAGLTAAANARAGGKAKPATRAMPKPKRRSKSKPARRAKSKPARSSKRKVKRPTKPKRAERAATALRGRAVRKASRKKKR